ncbi:MAG TPA: hypothetical protein VGF17_24440 [Phytomonospora sp.]
MSLVRVCEHPVGAAGADTGRFPVVQLADTVAVPGTATTPLTDAFTVVVAAVVYDSTTVRERVAKSAMLLLDHSPPALFENGVDPESAMCPLMDQSAPES